ncbi:MAG: PaaI family thioesterase [Syntrophomonadaceae bacterium]|jgi:acyl-CoA thioesterase|nr:PaaI family thioesterase [Syntrophomonadaceae bacterium]MDH7496916.1 PaaI family thioesterase [Syntrophomonadaceae bacterium]
MEVLNQGVEEGLFRHILESIRGAGFYTMLGIELCSLGPGQAELAVVPDQRHANPLGGVHGGLIASLADAAMGNAVRSLGIRGVTVECGVSYMGAATMRDPLRGRGRVVKAGHHLVFAEADVLSGERLVSQAKGVFFRTGDILVGESGQ